MHARNEQQKNNHQNKSNKRSVPNSSKSNNFLALIKDWKNGLRLTCAYKKEMNGIKNKWQAYRYWSKK